MVEQASVPFVLTQPQSTGGSIPGFQPLPVNLWETDEAWNAALILPGVEGHSLNVTVQDHTLAIEGELKFEKPAGAQTLWQEFGPATFRRSLRLGSAIDATRVEATYRDGILFLTLPKAEHARPRQVQVQVGEATTRKRLGAAGASPSANRRGRGARRSAPRQRAAEG